MADQLIFDSATVCGIGRSLKNTSRYMDDEWHPGADYGSDCVRVALDSLATALNDGLFGAATEVFSLGQGAEDSVSVFETDRRRTLKGTADVAMEP